MPSTTSKNLGQIAAVIKAPTAPTNTDVVWIDTSGTNSVKKIWDPIAQAWIPLTQSATVTGDNWGTQVVQHDASLDGDGTSANPLAIAQQGATAGQFLKWNGSKWLPAPPPTGGLISVAVDDTLKGNGTVGQPLGLAPNGATQGQVLIFDGTNWVPGAPTFNGFVRGMVMMWSGDPTALPTGWLLCDGTNGTPNLLSRFVVGYNPADGDYNAIGKQGGNKQTIMTPGQIAPHVHGVNDPGHTHTQTVYQAVNNGGNIPVGFANVTNNVSGSYSTGSSKTGISIQSTGNADPIENRPPYYALAFIMKS